MHEHVEFTGHAKDVLERLRGVCLAFPESLEVEQFGHPWFKAGKRPFVIFGHDRGNPQIAFGVGKDDQAGLCEMAPEVFFPTPYMHQHGWTSMRIPSPADEDWKTIEDLTETAYRRVALKRMLKALDG